MSPDSERRRWVLAALDRFELRLLRYAQRLTGSEEQARDVVQFVFLRLCDQEPRDMGDRLAAWLYAVCRNRSMDILRAARREKANGHAALEPEPDIAIDRHRDALDPADKAAQAELYTVLRNLVTRLPAAQREAIDLWTEGFSFAEISGIVGKQEGHVRVLVHRALKALREHPRVRALMEDAVDHADVGG